MSTANGTDPNPAPVGAAAPSAGAVPGARSTEPKNGRPPDDHEFARAVGRRLRAVRSQQRLSLHGVERKSGGKWKAVVVGSYERGDRAVSFARLAELADFYGVPLGELLLRGEERSNETADETGGLVLDLRELHHLTAADAAPLIRYAHSIQWQRGDYGNRVLSIRGEDLRLLALMFDVSVDQLTDKLRSWGALAPGSPGLHDKS